MKTAGRQWEQPVCTAAEEFKKRSACTILARPAHHMKTIFTRKNVLPDFLSMLSFGKQQKTHNTFPMDSLPLADSLPSEAPFPVPIYLMHLLSCPEIFDVLPLCVVYTSRPRGV